MKKKILCLLLTLVLIFAAALTGCAGKNTAVATQALLSAAEQVQKDGNYNSFTADVKVEMSYTYKDKVTKKNVWQYLVNQRLENDFPVQDIFVYRDESGSKTYDAGFVRSNGSFGYRDEIGEDSKEYASANMRTFEKRFKSSANVLEIGFYAADPIIMAKYQIPAYIKEYDEAFIEMSNSFMKGLVEFLEPSVRKTLAGDVIIKFDGKKVLAKVGKIAQDTLAYAKKYPSKTMRNLYFDDESPVKKLIVSLIGDVKAKKIIDYYNEVLKGIGFSAYMPEAKDENETLYEYFWRRMSESSSSFEYQMLSEVFDERAIEEFESMKKQLAEMFPGKLELEVTIDKNGVFKAMKTNFRFVVPNGLDVTVSGNFKFNVPVTIKDISEFTIDGLNVKVKDYSRTASGNN